MVLFDRESNKNIHTANKRLQKKISLEYWKS